jgi:hypothetical protein
MNWHFWQSDTPVEVAVVEGTIEHMFSDQVREVPAKERCRCCPNGRHRFAAHLATPLGVFSSTKHLDDYNCGINSFISQHGLDGRRVRITVELLPETDATLAIQESHERDRLDTPDVV